MSRFCRLGYCGSYSLPPLDTGELSYAQRAKVLDEIDTNDDVKVILMSLKAGGQGISFRVTSRSQAKLFDI